MKFDEVCQVDAIAHQMQMNDYQRSRNRALINALFNGAPPYSEEEAERNNIEVNVNFLDSTRMGHEARAQFYQNFLSTSNYFSCVTDAGGPNKSRDYSLIATQEINRIMKKSLPYMECFRSKIAMNVLHGISPAVWKDQYCWRPEAMGVDDVLVPANTLLTMDNLPFFAIRRSFTAPELIRLTRGEHVDKAWNKPMVEACIKWVDEQTMTQIGDNYPDAWSPEKSEERMKSDGGYYATDAAPTIDVFDFYFWSDEGGKPGWRRRMILDCWSTPSVSGGTVASYRKESGVFRNFSDQFLYNPGSRIYSEDRSSIINWQFADLSSVAPFRYHSVRSLGFLLYSVCHLQNRLRSKFNEAVFEQMLVYFRVRSADDLERALKVDLVNKGVIDDSIEFIKAQERHQFNPSTIELGIRMNEQTINQNAMSLVPQTGSPTRNNIEKTKFQVMAEMNAVTKLVSSALTQAAIYQEPEYAEIHRRFCLKDSNDPEVKQFQKRCLARGIPEKILYNPDAWTQDVERVVGEGNRAMELAIADQLMAYRNLYDPESQRQILRTATLAITSDPVLTDALVPMKNTGVTDSVHDAQLAVGTLMQGLPVDVKSGTNHIEYIETLLLNLAQLVQRGPASIQDIMGFQNIAQHIALRMQLLAQDKNEGPRVKQYEAQLTQIMNVVKAQASQMQQMMQAQGGQDGQMSPEDQAKIQAIVTAAQAKAEVTKEAHAQRTAQRQLAFEMKQQQEQQRFQAEMQRQQLKDQMELEKQFRSSAIDIKREADKISMAELAKRKENSELQ
ncbi:MAG TPA: hypothetical protein PKJ00_03435 [Verrucomicrobiota bacterium]|nr:hypothetical protein [Verrucomicrobiota bacterium]HNS69001.1 hypothetical protein [Verrucomicrobiota bacterium]